MSDAKRNETQLLCDVLGLESLVDEIAAKLLGGGADATPSAILGPFYRQGAPDLPNGASIARDLDPSLPWYEKALEDAAFIHGRVFSSSSSGGVGSNGSNGTDGATDSATQDANGKGTKDLVPLAGATIDVWHTAPNGLYEQQDPSQPDMNLRGRFTTDASGCYSFYCLRPVPYPVPDDGPAGRLLGLLDRTPYRPAHIHFLVEAEGHKSLVTQVFDAEDEWIGDDSVFAVKEGLTVRFERREGDGRAGWGLEYDFVLAADTIPEGK
jgi:catechol 1,2-dioxygenase